MRHVLLLSLYTGLLLATSDLAGAAEEVTRTRTLNATDVSALVVTAEVGDVRIEQGDGDADLDQHAALLGLGLAVRVVGHGAHAFSFAPISTANAAATVRGDAPAARPSRRAGGKEHRRGPAAGRRRRATQAAGVGAPRDREGVRVPAALSSASPAATIRWPPTDGSRRARGPPGHRERAPMTDPRSLRHKRPSRRARVP